MANRNFGEVVSMGDNPPAAELSQQLEQQPTGPTGIELDHNKFRTADGAQEQQ